MTGANIILSGSIGTSAGTSILGSSSVIFASDANHTLSSSEQTGQFLAVTSSVSLTTTRNLIAPLDVGRFYTVKNSTTGGQSIQIIGSSGTGVIITNGSTLLVETDGTNYFTPAGIIQLTGDGTAGPGSGSQLLTLASVNSNVGTFGSTTTIPIVTVNAKGLITAVSTASVTSGINQLTGDVHAGPGTGSQATTLATVNSNVGTFGSTTLIPSITVNAKGLITAVTTSTAAVSAVSGVVVSGTPSSGQVLTATSSSAADWQSLPAGTGITALTGDVTASGTGSVAATAVNLTGTGGVVTVNGTSTALNWHAGTLTIQSGGVNVMTYDGSATNTLYSGSQPALSLNNSGTAIMYVPTFQFQSSIAGPLINQINSGFSGVTGQVLTIQAQNVPSGAGTGGNLNLTSGTGTAASGSVNLQAGGTTQVSINSSEMLLITPNLVFQNFSGAPVIDQPAIPSTSVGNGAGGATFTIQGQAGQATTSVSGNGGPGGPMIIAAGTGGTSTGGVNGNGGDLTLTSGFGFNGGNLHLQTGNTDRILISPANIMLHTTLLEFDNTITAPVFTQASVSTASVVGQALTIQSQNTTGSGSTGGNLLLSSGTGVSAPGNVQLQTGGTSQLFINSSNITFTPATVEWGAAVSSPKLTQVQNTAASASGQTLTIQGQNCTGTTSFGGGVVISSGSGTSGSGNVSLQVAGSDVVVVQPTSVAIGPDSSGPAPIVVSWPTFLTTDSSPHVVETIFLPASPAVKTLEVDWIARCTGTPFSNSTGKNMASFFNNSGTATVIGINTPSNGLIYQAGQSGVTVTFAVSGSGVQIIATGIPATTEWTFIVRETNNLA